MTNGTRTLVASWWLLLLLGGAFLSIQAAPTDSEIAATSEEPLAESRSQKQDQDISDVDDDLDGRSAYVNNQFVPSEPVELVDDEQNTPLYEILQKQMEQVLAATGPDVPIYEDEKSKRQRVQHPPNKPLFTNNAADADDDYVDEAAQEPEQGYGEADKPDAVTGEELPDAGYQVPPLSASSAKPTNSITTQPPSSSSTTTIRNRPQRRRTTTLLPRTTRARASTQSKTTVTTQSSVNRTELTTSTTTTAAPPAASQKPRPHTKPIPSSIQPHDPQIYQHKRRIIFKTISTGSQFVNSPIGDLMIKFSIGFAKPAPGVVTPSNEAIRALSQNLLRSIELQKLKRINKIQRD